MIGFTPEAIISLLGTSLVGIAGLLSLLPVGTCSECGHCRLAKLNRQREHEQRARSGGLPLCPICGRDHQPGEDHRT